MYVKNLMALRKEVRLGVNKIVWGLCLCSTARCIVVGLHVYWTTRFRLPAKQDFTLPHGVQTTSLGT
jgi:hypothetical protein